MKKALASIVLAFFVLTIVFIRLGGVFDKPFWLAFLPGLMANLAILFVAVFVIDKIFQKERWVKLEQINARQSEVVFLLSNRLAYWLMEYLGLATEEEVSQDKALYFEFAIEKLKAVDLPNVFYQRMKAAEDGEAFVAGFVEKLSQGTEGLSTNLERIYPQPDPMSKKLVDDTAYSAGMIDALTMMYQACKEANKQVATEQQLKPDQMELLVNIAYVHPADELSKVQQRIIELSKRAKANRLFIQLD